MLNASLDYPETFAACCTRHFAECMADKAGSNSLTRADLVFLNLLFR